MARTANKPYEDLVERLMRELVEARGTRGPGGAGPDAGPGRNDGPGAQGPGRPIPPGSLGGGDLRFPPYPGPSPRPGSGRPGRRRLPTTLPPLLQVLAGRVV